MLRLPSLPPHRSDGAARCITLCTPIPTRLGPISRVGTRRQSAAPETQDAIAAQPQRNDQHRPLRMMRRTSLLMPRASIEKQRAPRTLPSREITPLDITFNRNRLQHLCQTEKRLRRGRIQENKNGSNMISRCLQSHQFIMIGPILCVKAFPRRSAPPAREIRLLGHGG